MIISIHSHRDTQTAKDYLVSLPESGVVKNACTKVTQITLIIRRTTITKDDTDNDADDLSPGALILHQESDGTAGYHGTL